MKFLRFAGVCASLFASIAHSNADTLEEDIHDGLSRDFFGRALKAVAASYLAMAAEGLAEDVILGAGATEEGIKTAKKEFSDQAKYTQYFETGERDEGTDDAILIEDGGQCFIAFQPTTLSFLDFMQNLDFRTQKMCNDQNECCEFSSGFVKAWENNFKLMKDVKDCVSRCTGKEVCLTITGCSQGGAVATVSSLELGKLTPNYEVITYAAPPSLTVEPATCQPHMDFDKHYRFGKALYKTVTGGVSGLLFDKVPFLGPDPLPGFQTFSVGNFMILSNEDDQNVAYVGFNTEQTLHPWDHTPPPLGKAHNLYDDDDTGYFQIVKRIKENDQFPVGIKGFSNGNHCGSGGNGPLICSSDRCDRATGQIHPTCKRKLLNGERCNSDVDCLSGRCPSRVPSSCVDKAKEGEGCFNNNDCEYGLYCPAGVWRKCKKIYWKDGRSAEYDEL